MNNPLRDPLDGEVEVDEAFVGGRDWNGYAPLAKLGYDHRPLSQLQHEEMLLPLAHRAISNLKTWLRGTYHGVSAAKLRNLPRRVRIPTQPPRQADGNPHDAAGSSAPRTHDLHLESY